MFLVNADPVRNRLYITLIGYLEAAERQEATKQVMAEAAKLEAGFDIVTDIRGLHATNKEGVKDLLRLRSALKLRGVGHIIRVVKIPLSAIQMQRVTEEAGFQSEQVPTLDAANRRLDELKAQPKPQG